MEKKKKKKKRIWLYVFYGLLTVGILFFALSINDLDGITKELRNADMRYVLIALLLAIIYLALYPLSLCFLAKSKGINAKGCDVYLVGMTEHFFNGITPFATGGQPFQAYALKRKGVPVATSTGLLIMNFLIFMASTNTFALVSLIFCTKFIKTTAMTVVAVLGFTINFAVFIGILLLGTSDKVRRGVVKLLKLLSKISFLKKLLQNKIEDFNQYTKNTQEAFHQLMNDKKTFALCYFTKLLTMFVYYSITFFVIKALKIDISYGSLFFTVCGTAFAVTTVVFLPTPGSTGGIEFAFSSIFSALALGASNSVSYGGMLIWRLITYYFTIFVSLVCYIIFESRIKKGVPPEADISQSDFCNEQATETPLQNIADEKK